MQIFKTAFSIPLNEGDKLSYILSHPSIQNKFEVKNKLLISRHSGNRKPKLLVSIVPIQDGDLQRLKIEIGLILFVRRLIYISFAVAVFIALLVFAHLNLFINPIIAQLDLKIRMLVYFFPLLTFFTIGVYYLAFMQELHEFRLTFFQTIKRCQLKNDTPF